MSHKQLFEYFFFDFFLFPKLEKENKKETRIKTHITCNLHQSKIFLKTINKSTHIIVTRRKETNKKKAKKNFVVANANQCFKHHRSRWPCTLMNFYCFHFWVFGTFVQQECFFFSIFHFLFTEKPNTTKIHNFDMTSLNKL